MVQWRRGFDEGWKWGRRAGLADAENAIEENPRAPDARTRPGDDEVRAGIFSSNFFFKRNRDSVCRR